MGIAPANAAMARNLMVDMGFVSADDEDLRGDAPPDSPNDDRPPVDNFEAFGGFPAEDRSPEIEAAPVHASQKPTYTAITPAVWKGTQTEQQRWLASARVPSGDLTIMSGNGGSGKTEIITQLLVYVAAGLQDWLGCTIEGGPALFLSCEEPEHNIRDRVERICKHRCIDPYGLPDLHMVFPDLESTWLVHANKDGRLSRAPLLDWLEAWIIEHKPRLVVVDNVAAVFDGEAIARRQVRAFLAMLRKIAREHDTAIVLLDHPSVRGMADGSGTANSVDWRNSVRSMLHLSDPEKDDPDARTLTVTKSNYGRTGERTTLRWGGLTFTTAMAGEASPYRAAADRDVEDVFLRLLDRRNAQGRPVHGKTAKGSAPAEFVLDPEAGDITADAFRKAMERLFARSAIRTVETGSPSKRRQHIERVSA
ncbi:RecA-family ATPase [Bradyrhizobium sp. Rc2d]|uniref:AAA family ATPase n=1 Tax=Bradyrhizobium sp. Rc2d TaxID=1855321 RepID=UPI000888CDB4|nr:AAA family ATPase [Bradyrhizobium sp. Rc2d]SDJ43875.1 RecA-family ATPase [Bradyrhizobium sp. Rc2d]